MAGDKETLLSMGFDSARVECLLEFSNLPPRTLTFLRHYDF